MTNFNIFLWDDNPAYLKEIASMIEKAKTILSDDHKTFTLLYTASSPSDLLDYISISQTKNNIYFLDIELQEEKSGIDLAEQIHEIDSNGQIVFVTSYQQFALLTYQRRINVLDYILKSLSPTELQKRITDTLSQAAENLLLFSETKKELFTYKIGTHIYNININDIYYLSTLPHSHDLALVTYDGSSYFRETIKNVAVNYPSLIKVSQACLINPRNIHDINLKNRTILFPNNDSVPYSFRYQKIIKNLENNKFS